MIHTVKGFGIVNKAEIDVFLELSCFFCDPVDVGNLISGSSAFSNLWLIILFLFSHPPCFGTLSNKCAQLFAKMDSTTETCRGFVHTYYGVALPPFLTPKEPYCTCADREVFLDLRRGPFISLFQHSSASVLGVSGESKT